MPFFYRGLSQAALGKVLDLESQDQVLAPGLG